MAFEGYAVVDFETTGFSPAHHHRVIEVAVVHVDPWGNPQGRWETVLNPARDLGPTHVHGLRGADVMNAPTFEQIASQVVALLTNRVLVAHNAAFEARFLAAEFARLNAFSPVSDSNALCTMRLASDFLPGSGRALADCCAAYDIELSNAHEALADAEATAMLLSAYLRQDANHPAWGHHQSLATSHRWPTLPAHGVPWMARRRDAHVERSFLHDTMASLPERETGNDATTRDYLAQLDQALADGFLSVSEADSLRDVAAAAGIGDSRRRALHHTYFGDLAAVAWADGVLTEFERAQLERVGQLLNIDANSVTDALDGRVAPDPRLIDRGLEHQTRSEPLGVLDSSQMASGANDAGGPGLTEGDLVVLTGEMPEARDFYEDLARQRGLAPWAAVTKKVALLVAEDPDSLSGKARKARTYGIPIVGVDEFLHLLNQLPVAQ